MKKCGKCKNIKPFDEFSKSKTSKNGLYLWCKSCDRSFKKQKKPITDEQKKEWHLKNRDRQLKRMRNYHASQNGRARDLHRSAMKRANIKGINFNISLEHIRILLALGKCQRSGIHFDLSMENKGNVMRNPFAPSLDRIDNSKGYEPDNIQLVCNLYNAGKGQHTDEQFIAFCIAVAQFNE